MVGAGMSVRSGIPGGAELASRMLRAAVFGSASAPGAAPHLERLASQYPFEAIMQLLAFRLPDHDVCGWLDSNAGFASAVPNEAHERLRDIRIVVEDWFPRYVYTTNFDRLLEQQFGDDCVEVTTENLTTGLKEAAAKRKVAVVHLHGSVGFPSSIMTAEGELVTAHGVLFDLLRGELAKDVFVIIGYSLTDGNLRRMFFDIQQVAQTRHGLSKLTYVVAPADGDLNDPSSPVSIATEVWRQRGCVLIPEMAEVFMETLLRAVHDFELVQREEKVAYRLGVPPDTLWPRLGKAAAPFELLSERDLLTYLDYALPESKRGPA